MKYILVLFAIMSFGCAGPMPKLPADQSFIELPLANNLGIVSSARVGNSDLNNCTNRGTKLMAHNNIGTKIHVELPAG